MKYAVAALALAVAVRAQDTGIPECAVECLNAATLEVTDCAVDDFVCICEPENYAAVQGSATTCVIGACGPEVALTEVLPATEALCERIGEGDGGEETNTPEPTPEPTEEPTEEPTPEPTEDDSTTPPPAETTPPPEPTVVPPPNNSTSTTSEPPVHTGGAPVAGPVGGLALFFLGLFAL